MGVRFWIGRRSFRIDPDSILYISSAQSLPAKVNPGFRSDIVFRHSRFDRQLNYWDLSSIGAALYGVARQGQDFFEASYLERATIIYNDMRLFVKSIGKIVLNQKGKRDILVVLLTDKDVNLGVMFLQLSNFAEK